MSKGRETKVALRRSFRDAFKGGGTITCSICEKPIRYFSDLTIDHILPKSNGGVGRIDNLAPAHFHCNQKKGSKIMADLIYEKDTKVEGVSK